MRTAALESARYGGYPGGDGGHLRLLETAYLQEDDIAEC